jgi:hypothetical protein
MSMLSGGREIYWYSLEISKPSSNIKNSLLHLRFVTTYRGAVKYWAGVKSVRPNYSYISGPFINATNIYK